MFPFVQPYPGNPFGGDVVITVVKQWETSS